MKKILVIYSLVHLKPFIHIMNVHSARVSISAFYSNDHIAK